MPDFLLAFFQDFAGSAGGAGLVVYVILRGMKNDIAEARDTAVRAHRRIDEHLNAHH